MEHQVFAQKHCQPKDDKNARFQGQKSCEVSDGRLGGRAGGTHEVQPTFRAAVIETGT